MASVCRPRHSERPGPKAFTLVEMLVVITIIAMLLTLLNPMAYRSKAQASVCMNNLRVLGVGWQAYWQTYGYRTPPQYNKDCADYKSQCDVRLYCKDVPGYTNAGVLYQYAMVPSERVYVCPTLASRYNSSNPMWFNPDSSHNPWPPQTTPTDDSYMTYGTRRMLRYDDSAIAILPDPGGTQDEAVWSTRLDKDIMMYHAGVRKALYSTPETYSFMADRFDLPSMAKLSHVPGVNVLWLEGHVTWWKDSTWDGSTGNVLYANGILDTDWNEAAYPYAAYNYIHDNIWMIIDGYHSAP
jgi:prepilin-type N-terminal cleavage/methylation domain-containing protein